MVNKEVCQWGRAGLAGICVTAKKRNKYDGGMRREENGNRIKSNGEKGRVRKQTGPLNEVAEN